MTKLQITALDGEHQGEVLEAQFNPKEIEVDRTIPWVAPLGRGPLGFLGAQPARMSFELLFDGGKQSKSVQPQLDKLYSLSSVDRELHSPPRVTVALGGARGAMPTFEGVFEAVSVRYFKFAQNGVPLRATAMVKLEEFVPLERLLEEQRFS